MILKLVSRANPHDVDEKPIVAALPPIPLLETSLPLQAHLLPKLMDDRMFEKVLHARNPEDQKCD